MKINALGHVVLRVTDWARAEQFYNGLLGLPIMARFDEDGMKMTFFSLGNHHDFAILEVSGEGSSHAATAVGLHHVAFKIGDSLDELREATALLEGAGVVVTRP
jgi:catechol 2,3-dioxygenase